MIDIRRFLPDSYTAKLTLTPVIVAFVPKQQAHSVILSLKNINTKINQLTHLKKIHKQPEKDSEHVQVLLCLEEEKQIKDEILTLLKDKISRLETTKVPESVPHTRDDYQQWSQIWPINYAEQEVFKAIIHSQPQISLVEQVIKKKQEIVVFSSNRVLFQIEGQGCQKGTIRHPIMLLLQQWPLSEAFKQLQSAYYLTKLRLMTKIPLCGMCAMALVHSRLERIYFWKAEIGEQTGDILSCERLNHRVGIFIVE